MTAPAPTGFINVGEALTTRWPSFLPQLPDGTIFDHLWAGALDASAKDGIVRASAHLLVEEELVLSIPGVDAVAITIAAQHGGTMIPVDITIYPSFSITLEKVPIALRLKSDLLRPAKREPAASAGDPPRWTADTSRQHVDIVLAEVTVTVNGDGDITFDCESSIDLPPCIIGDSGVVIEARDIGLHFSADSPAPGQPAGWRGIHIGSASLSLPGELAGTVGNLELTNAFIGNGGFTGAVSDTWTPALSAQLFGLDVTLREVEIEFVQNAPVSCALSGTVTLPFFDQAIGVDLHIGLDGSIGVTVSATQPAGSVSTGGVIQFTKAGVLTMQVDSLGFTLDHGVFTATMSGTLTPLVGSPGLSWPGFKLQELTIDSEGNVKVEGGWLNLPSQYSLDFYGFHVAITRMGLGSTDDGGKWIGFSGSIKLVDGIGIGGSVDGLRVTWYDDGRQPGITLDGVGVELDIPGTLRFKGAVSFHELPGQKRFDGDITLELIALDLRIDGKIVIGTDTNPATGEKYQFFALYIGVELPAGIPLWATGLGLFGIAGLVAIQMAPNKGAAPNALHPASRVDEEWFENADGSDGWYKRTTKGITDLRSKWDPVPGGFALGGGVTIGTVADNGFTLNGSVLLVISFPGPVILLEGKANLLKERASLADDPIFRAIAVLDFRAGNMLVGLEAKYRYGAGGELIEIGGSAEAFFDFNDASRWHLYLGRDTPKERRIRAEILSLFEANAYFMLDATSLRMGAWVGYEKRWSFGPLRIIVEAWIEGGVALSWKPILFHGDLWLHGKAELSVFGFGLGLSVDAKFAADVFDPFHVLAEFSVGISLPWPLPDFDVTLTLEWGPTPDEPPLPAPLKELAVEHFKSTASWPLPRGSLLQPNVNAGDGFLPAVIPAAPLGSPPPANAPVVPMDARPHITFGRSVHDDALIGVNPQPVWPSASPAGWERVGDPAANQGPMRMRFSLTEVVLSRWTGAAWAAVARKASGANPSGVKELYGSWAPTPQLPSGAVAAGSDPAVSQTKLWLWSKTPFDYSRHGGRAWDEWFTAAFPSYPCIPAVPERTICCSFDQVPVGAHLPLPHVCAEHPEIVLVGSVDGVVEALPPINGHVHALCWDETTTGTTTHAARYAARTDHFTVVVSGPSASHMSLVFAGDAERVVKKCIGFDQLDRQLGLPCEREGASLRLFDDNGKELSATQSRQVGGRWACDISFRAELSLPCPARRVTLTIMQSRAAVSVVGVDGAGETIAMEETTDTEGLVTIELSGKGIEFVVIDAPKGGTWLVEACWTCAGPKSEVHAIGVDEHGVQHGPFTPVGTTIEIPVPGLRAALVRGRGHVCLVQVCVTFPPDGTEVAARQAMDERLSDALALWGDNGEVLEADTSYALQVKTRVQAVGEGALSGAAHDVEAVEIGYFRTAGPPALTTLSTPVHHPPSEAFDSGLDDLTRYVRQTVPPTVPPPGANPLLPRPVYRAYDVGVEFNEDYVDLLYRLARRDLYLYLYDSNNQPVRDAAGRLIVSANRWGRTESVTLTESEARHVSVINSSTCVTMDEAVIPHQVTLFAVDPGLVLDPDIVYDARLVPLLFHDDFSRGIGAWAVVDIGTNQAPSAWSAIGHATLTGTGASAAGTSVTLTGAADLTKVDPAVDVVVLATDTARPSKTYRVMAVDTVNKKVTVDGTPTLSGGASGWNVPGWGGVRQTSNLWGGTDTPASVPKPGTMLVGGDATWTDYRYTVQLRSADDDAIGIVFRYEDAANHYRFALDRQRRNRRLVKVESGSYTLLAEDDFVYSLDQDYVVTIEAIDDWIRVYQDGALVFDVRDTSSPAGRVGLYCWANHGARFNDVRVDDFRAGAPVAYRFSFTTSRYTNVFHHLHSYDDGTWSTTAADGNLAAEIGAAVASSAAVSDAEARSFESLATKVLGQAAGKASDRVEVHAVSNGAAVVGLLVRSPEPIDWRRTGLTVAHAPGLDGDRVVPGALKLTDVVAGGSTPNDESVTVLARERTTLRGAAIDVYGIPGPLVDKTPAVLLDDDFDVAAGVLLEETFDANALDAYRIVDAAGATSGPSQWAVAGAAIVQSSNVYDGTLLSADPRKPGTVALTGGRWSNVRLTATVRSGDDDAIGVVLRHDDAQNWYRFSMDRQRQYRRLVKCVAGVVTVLWEDAVVYDKHRAYAIRIDAYEDVIVGFVDDALLFAVRDGSVHDGQVGFYCWANTAARFEALRVESLERNPLLWEAPFADATELAIVDTGGHSGPSQWSVAAGTVTQSSNIWGDSVNAGIDQPGTVALLGPGFGDHRISVRLRSADNDAIGIVFRYQDGDNWYRFSMDRQRSERRLVKCSAGTTSLLWQDGVAYSIGATSNLTVLAAGERIAVWLDGVALLDVIDGDIAAGRIGLYSWKNTGASFERLVVTDPATWVGQWEIVEGALYEGPSRWRVSGGALRQLSNAWSSNPPAAPGTTAVGGEPAWTDYRIEVRARSDDDDAIGVAFRWVDRHNHYRLSLDAQRSFRRLVKIVDGATTTLWEDADSYVVGAPVTLIVDAVGDRLVGSHDGQLLFDVTDGSHASGRVGLYSWANTGARIERVTVTDPPTDAYAMFADRFAQSGMAGWTVIDEGTQSGPSAWSVTGGALRQTSNIHSFPDNAITIPKPGTTALAGSSAWTDVVLSVTLRSTDNDTIGVVFRYQDAANHYRFSMDSQRGQRRLDRCVGGAFVTLWETADSYVVGERVDLVVAAVGERLTAWLDGVPLFEVDDDGVASGRIGMYCWADHGAEFSAVRVFGPDRLARRTIVEDDFDWETVGLWTFVTAGINTGPATWATSGGALQQTSNVWGGQLDAAELAKPGALALAGPNTATDYRVTVRLRSDDDDAIGVAVRYADADNWYRFSMDRERSYRRLVKCVAGVTTELWSDAVAYKLGREHLVTIDVVGDSIVGYVDGVQLFAVRDGDIAAGRVGLYCWANTGARFSSIRMVGAGWENHVRFGLDDEPLAAGTRVVVHSGNPTAWTAAPTPGVVHRFLATENDQGRYRLSTTRPTDVRVTRGEAVVHARSFLPTTSFGAVPSAEVLRKADGTSFAVLVPGGAQPGSQIASGTYRLTFTYRRNNTSAMPSSTVLSQAGDQSNEVAVLDVVVGG